MTAKNFEAFHDKHKQIKHIKQMPMSNGKITLVGNNVIEIFITKKKKDKIWIKYSLV